MAVVQAYHGVTGAEHQASFDKLSALGYRLISLSVYGDPGDARYAAVWVQRSGPAWVAVHGVDGAGYQAFFNTHTAQGYAPILVSATGGSSNAIFAAVFEQGVAGAWVARHGMTSGLPTQVGTFQYQNKAAADARMMLRSMAIYGTASDRRYAAIWQANPTSVKWHAHAADVAAAYQTTFNAETQLPGYRLAGYRPAYVTLSSDHNYCSVFKDDVVGTWAARHGLSAAEYQKEFDIQTAQGFYPICVQGGGAGPDTRYAAIFAKQDMPAARQSSVDGTAMPALASLDQTMQAFMKENGVRAAQLTVGKNGAIRSRQSPGSTSLRNGIPVALASACFEPTEYRAPNLARRARRRTIRALAPCVRARGGEPAAGAGGARPGFDRKRERSPWTAGGDDAGLE